MYEAFYGFKVKPFALSPQEEFIFLSRQHRMALELLVYGLRNQSMFCVVSGDIGTGKTTLMRHLFSGHGPSDAVAMITGMSGTFTDLMQWILSEFGIEYQGLDKRALQQALVQQLKWVNARNKRVILVIDEAQSFEPEVLEELRLFSNINAGSTMLLQTVLVGQPGLRETLRRVGMRPLAHRIGVDYVLTPLDEVQTHAYIRHRLGVAGLNRVESLFTVDACDAIFAASRGIPRIINLFCDTALVYGYADQRPTIDATTVNEMLSDKAREGGWLFQSRSSRRPQASDKAPASEKAPASDQAPAVDRAGPSS